MSSPWPNASTNLVAKAAGGVDVRAPPSSKPACGVDWMPSPGDSGRVVPLDVEGGCRHAVDEGQTGGLRRIDEMGENVPTATQRRGTPLVKLEGLQVLDQRRRSLWSADQSVELDRFIVKLLKK